MSRRNPGGQSRYAIGSEAGSNKIVVIPADMGERLVAHS